MKQFFDREPSSWEDLECLVAKAFAEMGYETERQATLSTVRGNVAMDVVAINRRTPLPTKIACECKYWKRAVSQDVVHAFRSVCADAGVHVGLIISKVGFQVGAEEKRQFTNIHLLTFEDFQVSFFDEWRTGMTTTLVRMRDEILAIFRAAAGFDENGLDLISAGDLRGLLPYEKYELLWGTSVSGYFILGAEFPLIVVDPRGDPNDLFEMAIHSHRQFFEVAKQGMLDARAAFDLPRVWFDEMGELVVRTRS